MNVPPEYSDEERVWEQSERMRHKSEGVLPPDREDDPERVLDEQEHEEWDAEHLGPEANEAHAAGQVCTRCGAIITASQEVRRLVDGRWMHEVCPRDIGARQL